MTLEDRVTELERRADSNDEAHEDMRQTLGAILEIVWQIRHDQKQLRGGWFPTKRTRRNRECRGRRRNVAARWSGAIHPG